jgi:hypothetical protein
MDNTIFKYNVMQTVSVINGENVWPARVLGRYYEDGIPSYKVQLFMSGDVLQVWEQDLVSRPTSEFDEENLPTFLRKQAD